MNGAAEQGQVCPICSSRQMVPAGRQTDRRKGLVGEWSLYECSVCHVTVLMPLPTMAELTSYYSQYSSGATVSFSGSRWAKYRKLRTMLHWLRGDVDPRDFIMAPPGTRMLDYGCGQAGYLVEFHERGMAISGAEMSGSVVQACQHHGLDVRQVSDPNSIPFDDKSFDIVYLMQVFEHVHDPLIFMQELRRILKPGGMLYLAVPNGRSFWRRAFGANWVSGWFAPFHLFHYDRFSLRTLAERHGFSFEECWTRTPSAWFLLNLKAWLYPQERRLDEFHCILDTLPARMLSVILLRMMELFVHEKDCLVIKFTRSNGETLA